MYNRSMPPHQPLQVLILTADAGFGHRSAAKAVAEALAELYGSTVSVRMENVLDDRRTPFFLRDSQSDYDKIVRSLPELYRLGYEASNEAIPTTLAEVALALLLLPAVRELLDDARPDVVLTTYPLYQSALVAAFLTGARAVPVLTVVTDLVSVHRLWFNPHVDACLVPTEQVQALALESGLDAARVQLTGIPVYPAITRERRAQAEIRAELGWRTDLTTLLAVGSRRVEHLVEALTVVNHFGAPLQLVVVAGKDEELYHQLQAVDWHIPTHLYEYVSTMPAFLHAADLLICKAGGLIVTEALACGLPLLLVDAIPGQETGNADYVVQGGAGELAPGPLALLEALAHLLAQDGNLLRQRAAAAARLGQPQAAYSVARKVFEAGQAGSPVAPLPRHTQRLREFANQIRNISR